MNTHRFGTLFCLSTLITATVLSGLTPTPASAIPPFPKVSPRMQILLNRTFRASVYESREVSLLTKEDLLVAAIRDIDDKWTKGLIDTPTVNQMVRDRVRHSVNALDTRATVLQRNQGLTGPQKMSLIQKLLVQDVRLMDDFLRPKNHVPTIQRWFDPQNLGSKAIVKIQSVPATEVQVLGFPSAPKELKKLFIRGNEAYLPVTHEIFDLLENAPAREMWQGQTIGGQTLLFTKKSQPLIIEKVARPLQPNFEFGRNDWIRHQAFLGDAGKSGVDLLPAEALIQIENKRGFGAFLVRDLSAMKSHEINSVLETLPEHFGAVEYKTLASLFSTTRKTTGLSSQVMGELIGRVRSELLIKYGIWVNRIDTSSWIIPVYKGTQTPTGRVILANWNDTVLFKPYFEKIHSVDQGVSLLEREAAFASIDDTILKPIQDADLTAPIQFREPKDRLFGDVKGSTQAQERIREVTLAAQDAFIAETELFLGQGLPRRVQRLDDLIREEPFRLNWAATIEDLAF